VRFLQELVRVPTDTPPGNNAPHAERTATCWRPMGLDAEAHAVPADVVQAHGLQSITNLIVRRRFGQGGRVVALNAHGDVVPPGEGWTHDPYGAQIVDGKLYGRAAAVSKSDFRHLHLRHAGARGRRRPAGWRRRLALHLRRRVRRRSRAPMAARQGLTKPDLEIAAGFSYQVVTAHNGCLQLEATVHGKMGHAAVPETAVDALQAATRVLVALYEENTRLRQTKSAVKGITSGYINVGQVYGGTNTNVVPGKVVLKIDRRMIPEEDPAQVEAGVRRIIEAAVQSYPGTSVEIKRLLLAHAMKPLAGNKPLVDALCSHATEIMGETVEATGTPLYTDARLFSERGIPAVIYGAGPRTVLESNAKRADEHIVLEDLRKATKVVARTLLDLLKA
jgi:succinyl-diaminopimelate desuccinylase